MALIQRTPTGKIRLVFGEGLCYELDKESAWDDLNAIMDDPELPEPEMVSVAANGMKNPTSEALDFVEQIASEIYGPVFGKLFKTAAIGGKHIISKAVNK